jgi:hypothetical protein
MAKRSYPLELILRAHGPCELLNSNGDTLWASDADDDFKEEFTDEFLEEEDIGDILDYLFDNDLLSMNEVDNFTNQKWQFNIETLENSVNDPGDDDDDEENEDFD